MDDEDGDVIQDERFDWIYRRILHTLRPKEDVLEKMKAEDEYSRSHIIDFLDDTDIKRLLVFVDRDPKVGLCCRQNPPATYKKNQKAMFFAKTRKIALTNERMQTDVICGDYFVAELQNPTAAAKGTGNPLEYFHHLSNDVFLPLLHSAGIVGEWPETMQKEVLVNLHDMTGTMTRTIGESNGTTQLALPPDDDSPLFAKDKDGKSVMDTKDKAYQLETSITNWAAQIKDILKANPEEDLKAGRHVGPKVEIEFWRYKADNLNAIHAQLKSRRVEKVIGVLEEMRSTYLTQFIKLIENVSEAMVEANDNVKFLQPLVPHLTKLEMADESSFPELPGTFSVLMHTLMFIWKHSKFYNTPSRLVVLMREVCNDLIKQATKFLDPENLFEEEPQDAVDKLKTSLRVCGLMKTVYFGYKARVALECPDNPWRFQNSALFARLDSFLERCHDILELTNTVLQFSKLETMSGGVKEPLSVGGTKGKVLTTSVAQIFADFTRTVSRFHHIEYNLLDVDAEQFDDDFYLFRRDIKELERRLGSVVTQGIDDCSTVYGKFKLLDSFDAMLQREVIIQDLEKKHVDLVNDFGEDLRTVLQIFTDLKEHPIIGRNMPPVAGAVLWIRGLKERIVDPFERFKTLHASSVIESEETKQIFSQYRLAVEKFDDFEQTQFGQWCEAIENVGQDKLKQSLLMRYTDGGFDGRGKGLPLLRVNFDPALTKLMREVRYLKMLNLEVPEGALAIFERYETFRQQMGNLDLIAHIYNGILLTLKEVEKPMLQLKMDKIDDELKKGCSSLTWKSHGINEFIVTTMSLVKDTAKILSQINANVAEIERYLERMTSEVMFERNDQKTLGVEEYGSGHEAVIADRHDKVQEDGLMIHELLIKSNKTLRISKGAASWKAYVDYISSIVINGMSGAIQHSIDTVMQQLDEEYLTKNDMMPLLEVKLELVGSHIEFTPAVGGRRELRGVVMGWAKDFANIAKLVARLDTGEGDYLYEMEEDTRLVMKMEQLNVRMRDTEEACLAFAESYAKFSYLWLKPIEDSFQDFLATAGELEDPDGPEDGPRLPPSLKDFDEEILKYKTIQSEVGQLPNNRELLWLKVDSKPIKHEITNWVGRWSFRYTQHLLDDVTDKVEELMAFIADSTSTMEQEVPDGDKDKLVEVMGCLRDVRSRMESTDAMFDPLRNTTALLKRWGLMVSDEVLAGLEEAPVLWNNVKKQYFATNQRLEGAKAREAENIKRNVATFNADVLKFRNYVKEQGPFQYHDKWRESYAILSSFNMKLNEMEEKAKYFNEMQDLFDLTVTEYKDIKLSRRETSFLKSTWDMVSMVVMTFQHYRRILWSEIDVDSLMDECKKLSKTVRSLDKYVKNWPVYKDLEAAVKNMITSLPLVADLAHPSMRDRHWKQLMRASGKSFTMDDSFSLGDLLALQLHKYVEEVAEIVDKAQKELNIEKQLQKMEETWDTLQLQFTNYGETEVKLLVLPEELVEALDEGQVQLQALGGSKYVAGNQNFHDQVSLWQNKLGAVDQTVRTTWLEVQTKWVGLEPIFIGSADIRVQLPQDSKRFDGIDGTWKEMMKEAEYEFNPITAALEDERQEMLEDMLGKLELCEKSLNDYLETKRVAFPRFYFVAAADLLDILSKGSMPWLLQKHFSKNFDSIDKLNFEVNADGSPSKTAVAMVSPQKEVVTFYEPLECSGPVEVWLNKVMEWMRLSLKHVLNEAAKSYEERPRHEWALDWCAQMAILVSRVIYTEDVGLMFDQLEEGNDNALKDYQDKCQEQLKHLSVMLNGKMDKGDRRKIITLVTIDVHARDVVGRLVQARVESADCFEWQSQLRYRLNETTGDCENSICDYTSTYIYEYIGNCGALVITPLTDRCYITLTQAARLILGGAPAGPAGTGKTETTKDLGRALGIMVYVFNCSDQMDYRVMANIYKGLAQTGCWGCFDEFNRITIEVLSVCSTQYKTVLDGIRAGEPRFDFDDESIPIFSTAMAFITMNPGYAGRTELPESLKALFRPVSMVVPDMVLITEIMLFSEGFVECKLLARKFMLCYSLAADLLSKADHYDWKLRAVKTTLCVAGSMKRAAPELTEDKIILRALRDFNLGKLSRDDVLIFMGLLEDLFPKTLELVPSQKFPDFEDKIRECGEAKGYQTEETFVLKISQLREIFQVRWSVFLLGVTGSAKTVIWQTLLDAQNASGEKGMANTLNPKGVSRHELYGYVSMATREWKDGLLSQIFRDFSNNTNYEHQWIVLDGDIDAEWIETMNTVMDDNKLLTLVSGERIPLTPPMRLLFEIADLRNASPATVSRAGVIFVNEDDIGWSPFVQTWLETRSSESERATIQALVQTYVPKVLEALRKQFKQTVPTCQLNNVCTLCYLLDGLLGTGDDQKKDLAPEVIENFFVWAAVWAFGGNLLVDKSVNHSKNFSAWWIEEFKTVKFGGEGLVFDYQIDTKDGKFMPWQTEGYLHTPGMPVSTLFVETAESSRVSFLMDLLITNHHFVMLVGNAGTGKTVMMQDKLKKLDEDTYLLSFMAMNSMTDSMSLQLIMDQQLEKKAGIVYGPPGNKTLIYFIDDLNMPVVDTYGTQEPIALLRCFCDYGLWYEREKLGPNYVKNCDIMACMNPTAGSFVVDARFQRQFSTFSCQLPPATSLSLIYGSILDAHLLPFEGEVSALQPHVTAAAADLQTQVANTFLPSAVKFHYIFNLRDISNVFGGLLRCNERFVTDPSVLLRLFIHEAERVYRDRLVSEADLRRYDELQLEVVRRHFGAAFETSAELDELLAGVEELNIFTAFHTNTGDDNRPYLPVKSWDQLQGVLDSNLSEHNETNAVMELVLFSDAMQHVSRIARIVEQPRGNALLVGVGGSGKQSLARLAAFICGYEVFQITVTSSYNLTSFKEDLAALFKRSGTKDIGILFLLTDQQIVDEQFLVCMNDMLSSGDIPNLFAVEDIDDICNAIRPKVKQAGIIDTRENCWEFYINNVRRYLHVALCFSPVGDTFRVRARQFPALVSCTQIDWFHAWSQEALIAVAQRFLSDMSMLDEELKESLANHMAHVHNTVTDASARYLETERRRNYTTPKSFLELIALYKSMLASKLDGVQNMKERLESGLEKLQATAETVAELQDALVGEQEIVEEKKKATDALLAHVGQETASAEEQKDQAAVEEEAADAIAQEVGAIQAQASKELEAAEPIIAAAEAALNSLDKSALTELKAFGSPAEDVVKVASATIILTAGKPKVPRDVSWAAAKKMMGNVGQFLDGLLTFDKDNVDEVLVEAVEKRFLSDAGFTPENIRTKSAAAAGLCDWSVNICKYFRIYQQVAPLRVKLAEANAKLDAATAKLTIIRAQLAALDEKLGILTDQFQAATEDKNAAIAQAEKTQNKANLANRLVNGLASEGVRWKESIEGFGVRERTLIGDVMLASAFVSYVGSFNAIFRTELVTAKWLPDMTERQIPMTVGLSPVDVLATDTDIANWSNEKLPSDTVSVQNGAIIVNSARWPVMIDPQLQGIGWIMERERANNLVVVQLTTPKYLDQVEQCMTNGTPIMIENMGDTIDAVLEPVLSRSTIKKGRSLVIKLGDKEVDYNTDFQLYMQTKLSNPHYIPEVQAQCTMVNFTVTEKGLEDQLLALVVNKERPDLEAQRSGLIKAENDYKVQLSDLEDNLLMRLANAEGDILEDIELIENLEQTKRTSAEIGEKVALGQQTAITINKAREVYRPCAARGSLLYFLVDKLNSLEHMYQYSMANYIDILSKGIDETPTEDKEGNQLQVTERVAQMVEVACFRVFTYVASGLFERHKMIFSSQLCFKIQQSAGTLDPVAFDFLLRGPQEPAENPLSDWLSAENWNRAKALEDRLEQFSNLTVDMEGSAKRWKEWVEEPRPESVPLPGDWKRLPAFDRLLILRCIRPDRTSEALQSIVAELLGKNYTLSAPFDLERSFMDSRPDVPIFFFLSPGVDVMASVEALHKKMGAANPESAVNNAILSVSLGQGQEPVANRAIEKAHQEGGWVALQNIHLTPGFCKKDLEPRLDKIADGAHPDFRLFLSAEPSAGIPISVLQACVKLTNEPPDGMRANLLRSISYFNDDMLEECSKQAEFKNITFALCYFHACMLQRKKFGSIGFNFVYPFTTGDLINCSQCCVNYLENNSKVPWNDLRYLFGEVMYGGHIFNDWDRVLSNTYLEQWLAEPLLDTLDFFPGFASPGPLNIKGYVEYIEEQFPPESPQCYGLHPNAEIAFRLDQARGMFSDIQQLQPRSGGSSGAASVEDKSKMMLDDILDKLPEAFDLIDINDKLQGEERTPFTNVFLQEIERMNVLLDVMKQSLLTLDLGLRGDLTISDAMENLMSALFFETIPPMWEKKSYPTLRSLGPWVTDVIARCTQLADWTGDLAVPKVSWFPGFFNPQSFLTAVMQSTARRNEWPLDKTINQVEVTKKLTEEEVDGPSREGAFVHGLMIEGCRWDDKAGALAASLPKELFTPMPVMLIKAVTVEKAEQKDTYNCPVYKTRMRPKGALGHPDGGFIFTAGLKTKEPASKWVMAGVALLTDIS